MTNAPKTSFLTGSVALAGSHALSLSCFYLMSQGMTTNIGKVLAYTPASPILTLLISLPTAIFIGWKMRDAFQGVFRKILGKFENKNLHPDLLKAVEEENVEDVKKYLPKVNLSIYGHAVLKEAMEMQNKEILDLVLARAHECPAHNLKKLNSTLYDDYLVVLNEYIQDVIGEVTLERDDDEGGWSAALDFILPYSQLAPDGELLSTAIDEGGNVDLIKKILPYEDPKKDDSFALQAASFHGRLDLVSFLYPLSDPEKALKSMEKRKDWTDEERHLLRFFVSSEKDKEVLTDFLKEKIVEKETKEKKSLRKM